MCPEIEGAQTFENLAENGRACLVISDPPTHENLPIQRDSTAKTRSCTEADYTVQEIYISKLIAHLESLGYGEHIWGPFVKNPAMAVTFEVEDIFVQTPGPGGRR